MCVHIYARAYTHIYIYIYTYTERLSNLCNTGIFEAIQLVACIFSIELRDLYQFRNKPKAWTGSMYYLIFFTHCTCLGGGRVKENSAFLLNPRTEAAFPPGHSSAGLRLRGQATPGRMRGGAESRTHRSFRIDQPDGFLHLPGGEVSKGDRAHE